MNPLTDLKSLELQSILDKRITIKNKTVTNRLFLAPMAGLGHIAFRELVHEFGGAGLLFTGMCSAKAVPHENPNISLVFRWRKEELSKLVCQIFGPDPASMALAAQRIEKEGFFGVDLNFGCSVAAICKKGCGAQLLKTPNLAAAIVKEVRKAVSIPVFVKFRTGWTNDPKFAADMAKRFEDNGADLLVFHPRISPDRRSRPPILEHIARVREAVSIPVFGNGNLFDQNDALKMLDQTGCDGLSVGRMAVAQPWLFASWTKRFKPGPDIHYETAKRMTQLLLKHYDHHMAVKFFKKYIPYFTAGFQFGHSMQKQLLKGGSMDEILVILDNIFENRPETTARPNANLFV